MEHANVSCSQSIAFGPFWSSISPSLCHWSSNRLRFMVSAGQKHSRWSKTSSFSSLFAQEISWDSLSLKIHFKIVVVLIEDFLARIRFFGLPYSILNQSSFLENQPSRLLHLSSYCSRIISSIVSFNNFICAFVLEYQWPKYHICVKN